MGMGSRIQGVINGWETSMSKIKNFTPVLDTIVKDIDLLAGAVYGRIWRYEQGKQKVCRAAINRIASDLGISPKTVERRINILEEKGYLKDLTPDRRNKPHDYVTTGKAGLRVEMVAYDEIGTTESLTGKSESRSHYVTKSDEESIKKQVKDTKFKTEEEGTENPFDLWESATGKAITEFVANMIGFYISEWDKSEGTNPGDGEYAVCEAIKIMGLNGITNLKYVDRILFSGDTPWVKHGVGYQATKRKKAKIKAANSNKKDYTGGKYAEHVES